MSRFVQVIRQRQAGADADFEDAAADAFGRSDPGLAAAIEHRAEHQIVDRRPARIGLGDAGIVEFPPCVASGAAARRRRCLFVAQGGTVLAITPPPSTRAWPSAAS